MYRHFRNSPQSIGFGLAEAEISTPLPAIARRRVLRSLPSKQEHWAPNEAVRGGEGESESATETDFDLPPPHGRFTNYTVWRKTYQGEFVQVRGMHDFDDLQDNKTLSLWVSFYQIQATSITATLFFLSPLKVNLIPSVGYSESSLSVTAWAAGKE